MATNDTFLFSVIGTVFGQQHIHTMHFRLIDPLTSEAAFLTDWETNIGNAYRALFVGDTPTELLRASQVCGSTPLRAPSELTPASSAGTRSGTGLGDALPPWLASQASVRTASAGRSRRGRFYLGGLYEYDINGSNLVAANTPDTRKELDVAYINAFLGRYGPSGTQADKWVMVVHSRKLAAVPGTQCQNSSTLVTGIIHRNAVASMRSRRAGHGN